MWIEIQDGNAVMRNLNIHRIVNEGNMPANMPECDVPNKILTQLCSLNITCF